MTFSRRRSRLSMMAAVLVVIGVYTTAVQADELVVPTDYPTIQSAVDTAVDGDVVLLLAGTYAERVSVAGKSITIHGVAGADATVIDGATLGTDAPLVEVVSGVVMLHELSLVQSGAEGFRIGREACCASGADCCSAAAVIDRCVIRGNAGRGVFVDHSVGSLTATNCTIADNTGDFGAGLFIGAWCDVSMTDCLITDNVASGHGGGVRVMYFGTGQFERCRFSGNAAGTDGGAVHIESTPATFTDCRFEANTAAGSGGALYVHGDLPLAPTVAGSTFCNNTPEAVAPEHWWSFLDGGGNGFECIGTCDADLDASGVVGIEDLLRVLADWGDCAGCASDLDGDGLVGIVELLRVLAAWGPCA